MAAQKPRQPLSATDALGRVAALHPGVLCVSSIGSRSDRLVAEIDAIPDPQLASTPPRLLPFRPLQRMGNWLRRYLPA